MEGIAREELDDPRGQQEQRPPHERLPAKGSPPGGVRAVRHHHAHAQDALAQGAAVRERRQEHQQKRHGRRGRGQALRGAKGGAKAKEDVTDQVRQHVGHGKVDEQRERTARDARVGAAALDGTGVDVVDLRQGAAYGQRADIAEEGARGVDDEVVHVKEAVGVLVDAVEAAKLRELKEQRGAKAGDNGVPPLAAKEVVDKEADGEGEQHVEQLGVDARLGDEPKPAHGIRKAQACRGCSLPKLPHELKGHELRVGGIGHHGCAALRQRQDDHVVGADGVEDEREHHEALPRRDGAVAAVLVDHVRHEGDKRHQRKRQRPHRNDPRICSHGALPF